MTSGSESDLYTLLVPPYGTVTPMMEAIRRGEWDNLIEYLKFPPEWQANGQTQFRLYPIDTYLARELIARRVALVRGEAGGDRR